MSPTSAPEGGTVAAALGTYAAGVREADAPAGVRHRLRAVIADVLADAVAGSAWPDVRALRSSLIVGSGPSSVIGSAVGLPPSLAAFVNAVPIAREQLQDGHRRARGHPASHVVPAVLAVAESLGSGGTEILSAILAGYEVAVRLGVAMDGTPAGVHDISTWATLGAAAGVAHLASGGDAATIAASIELAASLPMAPDARNVFSGATSQDLYLGIGAQAGVLYGQAAAAGIRSEPGTLERHFAAWLAADAPGLPGRVSEQLEGGGGSTRWSILEGYLKRHPTCALLHGVNDLVEEIAADRVFAPDEVQGVQVRTYRAAADFDEPRPATDMAARFSIPWTVAAGLAFGGLPPAAFAQPTLRRADLLALAERVDVAHDPLLDPGYPAGRPAAVTVRLRNGEVIERRTAGPPRGDGPAALSDDVVRAKPGRLLTAAGGPEWAAAVLAAVEGLGDRGLEPLAALLRSIPAVPGPKAGLRERRPG